VNQMKFTIEAS